MKHSLTSTVTRLKTCALAAMLYGTLFAAGACTMFENPAGEDCTANDQCASNQCLGLRTCDSDASEGEGEDGDCVETVGVCAEESDADNDNPALNLNCGSTANGDMLCDNNILYECIRGSKVEVRDCRSCKYVGPGTGSKYATSCKASRDSAWEYDFPKKVFPGPGCYFGSSKICD